MQRKPWQNSTSIYDKTSPESRNKRNISSVQFSRSVVSDSLQPHESQHARPPCPSPTPGVHSDSRPSSQWCHPAISSLVIPFSSCPQSLPASKSFPMSQLFTWSGQSTGASALASFLPKKSQGWSMSAIVQSFEHSLALPFFRIFYVEDHDICKQWEFYFFSNLISFYFFFCSDCCGQNFQNYVE